jgi:Trk-type K+ transport system membrane component
VAFTFPNLLHHTQPYTFLVFVGTATFFLFFTVEYVPETKGLSVAQVTEEFKSISLPTQYICCPTSAKAKEMY